MVFALPTLGNPASVVVDLVSVSKYFVISFGVTAQLLRIKGGNCSSKGKIPSQCNCLFYYTSSLLAELFGVLNISVLVSIIPTESTVSTEPAEKVF